MVAFVLLPTVGVVASGFRGQQTLGGSIFGGRCVCVHTLVFHMLCYIVLSLYLFAPSYREIAGVLGLYCMAVRRRRRRLRRLLLPSAS